MKLFKIVTIASVLILCPFLAWAMDFGIEKPYQEAVPAFVEAVAQKTEEVLDADQLQDIARWHATNMGRLDEFLDDLLHVAQNLKGNLDSQPTFDAFEGFSDKWNNVSASFPYFSELEPHLEKLVRQATERFPRLSSEPLPSGSNPVASIYNLYQESERTNPWGLASLWQLPTLNETTVSTEYQSSQVSASEGAEQVKILDQKATVQNNGEVVYLEDFQTQESFAKRRSETFLHEALEEAKQNNVNLNVIEYVHRAVSSINENVFQRHQEQSLDGCSYSYITRRDAVEFIENCEDVKGKQQSLTDLFKNDPFDWIRRR